MWLALLLCFVTARTTGAEGPVLPAAAPPGVGILLPLSGRYQSFGEPCLRGIRLALRAVGSETPLVRTVVLDTRGEGADAAQAYQRLAADPGIVAVLGPMLSWELESVKAPAITAGLPTFTFSQRTTPLTAPIYRFSMSKEDQARTLAAHLVADRGLRRWAILHPDDSYGQDLAALFGDEVARLGGEVVVRVRYDPAKTDFQTDVQRLQSQVGGSEESPPDIDGVFIPDSAEKVVLLAPHLAFFDIRNVQLAGASGWNRATVLAKALPYVNGAVFVDGFFLYSFSPRVREFVDAYRDAYHSDPGILEAYGYDAARLVLEEIQAGVSDRRLFLERLHGPRVRSGATGPTRLNADGRIDKSLFLLRMEEGTVREVDAPTMEVPESDLAPLPLSLPSPAARRGYWRRPAFDSREHDQRRATPRLLPPEGLR